MSHTHSGDWYLVPLLGMSWAMYVYMASSKWSGGDPLVSVTAASKYLSQGREQEDFADKKQEYIRRHARNV